MVTRRKILQFARDYRGDHPDSSDRELREALHRRFLGNVDYLDAAVEASSKSPTTGFPGCLAALVLAPLFALWYAVFPRDKKQIAQDIEAAVEAVRKVG
jgi:hypothetical protein